METISFQISPSTKMFSEGARKNNTRYYTNPSSLKQDILDHLKGNKKVHNYLEGTGKIITSFNTISYKNGSFYLIFSLGEVETVSFLVPTIHHLYTEVISSGKRFGPKKLIINYDNNVIVISPVPDQPRQEEFDKNLLIQKIRELRYLYDRGLSNQPIKDLIDILDSIHVILTTLKAQDEKKLIGNTMRLLEVLDECSESDKSNSIKFGDLIGKINNQISNTKGRQRTAINSKMVESLMTKDQKAYTYKYLETLKALIIKYRLVLSNLFQENPNERVKPTDTIQNRILFIFQIISYLYSKDVENSLNSDMPLIGLKTKTKLPTIFHQIIMDTNLLGILETIVGQRNLDISNVGGLGYTDQKTTLDKYIQNLYDTLTGTSIRRS